MKTKTTAQSTRSRTKASLGLTCTNSGTNVPGRVIKDNKSLSLSVRTPPTADARTANWPWKAPPLIRSYEK